jgi:hypothetical protein
MLQRMIELVAELARYEGRWAVAVLNDILRQRVEGVPANGPAESRTSEPAPR